MYRTDYFFLGFGVPFLSGACVNADAATVLTFAGVLGLLKSFEAILATLGDVFSLFAMIIND